MGTDGDGQGGGTIRIEKEHEAIPLVEAYGVEASPESSFSYRRPLERSPARSSSITAASSRFMDGGRRCALFLKDRPGS